MSAPGAYKLRARADAKTFAEAWDIALAMGRDRAFEIAYDRAVNGYTVPRFYRGRQVGTAHRYDHRMLVAALNPIATPPQDRIARDTFARIMQGGDGDDMTRDAGAFGNLAPRDESG